MKPITQTLWALGLIIALGLVGGTPVLAQPAADESGSTGKSSAWRFDAGVSKVPGLRFGWGTESSTTGAWIGASIGKLGLSVDYWHAEEYRKGDKYTPGLVETAILDQIDLAGVWRFGHDRVLSPYVLAGVGFDRTRYHNCWDTQIGRRCTGTSGTSISIPADGGLPLVQRRGSVFGLYGAGIDLNFGSRFFVRAQMRAYTDPDAYIPLLAVAAIVVGGGVRF